MKCALKGLIFLLIFYHDLSAGLKNLQGKPQHFGDNWRLPECKTSHLTQLREIAYYESQRQFEI